MQRRQFLSAAALAGAGASAAEAAHHEEQNQVIAIHQFYLRNSREMQANRLREAFEKEHLPACKRNDIGPAGYFQVTLGPDTPRMLLITPYDSMADYETKLARLQGDKGWKKFVGSTAGGTDPLYVRMEASLLRAFDGMKKLEVPTKKDGGGSHHFDLRTYEAETLGDLESKVSMFNQEEIGIFRKVGVNPVFFGTTVFGRNMPNLTYMVCYDDMDARDAAWKKFAADPDWKRISGKPEWKNAEVVSNITNTFLRALPFSQII